MFNLNIVEKLLMNNAQKDNKVNFLITLIPTFQKGRKKLQKPSKKCLNSKSPGHANNIEQRWAVIL